MTSYWGGVCSKLKGVDLDPLVDCWGIDNCQVFQYLRHKASSDKR